jgi:hypothetical protein
MSARFECSRCSVVAAWLPEFEPSDGELPIGWADADGVEDRAAGGELLCLRCRRDLVVQRAVEAARAEGTPLDEIGTKIREAALVRFEIDRDPARSNVAIARAAKSSTQTVAAARRRMREEAAGDENGRGSHRATSPRAAEGLRAARSEEIR